MAIRELSNNFAIDVKGHLATVRVDCKTIELIEACFDGIAISFAQLHVILSNFKDIVGLRGTLVGAEDDSCRVALDDFELNLIDEVGKIWIIQCTIVESL